ncbi:E3 ubiquitin ligase big brother-like [Thalictrum thalictroides]|uniref:E3 ubiquitin ligase big brother-like n=1 Tax=Thalictrum thalictroides TaxID=46969 RepID=A0A7J6XER4_THATH|nr:E3 ubiquitin ligase big brother-like [Thalictrum thalictroides]
MAGMLPGVELARRRRTNHHHHHHQFEFTSRKSTTVHHHQKLGEPIPSSSMDETALMARKRLEHKLRGFSSAPSSRSRWSKESLKGDKSFNPVAYVKETHSGKRQGKQTVQLDRRNSQRQVCSICLEDLQAQQQVMNLPCCHRYHSDCLLPWLSAHSHCPYCRTNVMSSAN